jgi:uncharacterized protein DUF6228
MTQSFLIRSTVGGTEMMLEYQDRDSYLVTLKGPDLEARGKVWNGVGTGLGDFVAELARSWRGWDGLRKWSSMEGELELEAVMDRTGHVHLTVALQYRLPVLWRVQLQLVVEAGQLDRLAADAMSLERTLYGAA